MTKMVTHFSDSLLPTQPHEADPDGQNRRLPFFV